MKKGHYIFSLALIALMSCNGEKQMQKSESMNFQKAQTVQTAVAVPAEETGVVKYYDVPLKEALEIAKKEGKLLFIDCSTSTCGPCRMMRKSVFTKKKCSDYINSNFIPLHINMDEGEGIEIAKKYNVGIYPTYLFLNSDGTKHGEVVGADKNLRRFLEKLKSAAEGNV